MSEKLNKKTILVIAIVAILSIIAITGSIAFLKNKGTSEAAEISTNTEEQSQGQEQDSSNSEIANQTEDTSNQNENSEQAENETTNQEETNATNGEVAENNQTENGEEAENNQTQNNTTTGNNQTQNAGTTANNQNQGTTTNNQGGQTTNNQNAGVDEIQGTTITRVEEIRERKVSDDRDIGWTPIALSAEMASAKINAEKSDIEVHKYASTKTGINLVREEEEITYTIHVKNNSKETLNNIEVTDKIPEKTTYVETDDNAQQIKDENGEVIGLKWYINIAPDEVVGIQFKVRVNEDETGTVLNTAIANGEDSEEVQTAIIEQEKSYIVTRNVSDEETEVEAPVKVGDKITFIISVKNTGDIDGTTTIKDTDLEQILADNKAEMVGNVTIYNGEEIVSSEKTVQDLINGIENVTIPAKETTKVTFTVKVNKIVGKIINEAEVGDEEQKPTNEVVIDTLNLDIVKDVKEIIRNNEKVEEPAKVDDIIYYDIKVKNTGTVEKEAKVEDILENNNLDIDVYYNNEIVTKITLMPGEEKLLTASYVVTQEDVDNQTDLRNIAKIIYDNEEKQDDAITPVVEADPAIKIIKTAIKVNGIEVETDENENVITKVRKDDIVTFSIKVINTGNITLNDVKVTDDLKVNYNGTEFEPGETIKTIATLAPNGEDTFEVTYEVTSEDMNLTKIINIATAKAIVEDKKSDDENVEDGTVEEPESPENPQDPQEPVNPPKTYEISDSDDAEVPINPNVSVSGTKIWEDENNRDGIRPDNITIKLVSSDETDNQERTTTIGKKQDGTYDWTYTFENLPKYDSERKIITYTVTEEEVDSYEANNSEPQIDEAGNTVIDITNTHEIETVTVRGQKSWLDDSDRDGIRPDSIMVQLYVGEDVVSGKTATVTPDEDGNWNYEFTDLPKYKEGKQGEKIEYSVKEVEVPDGYSQSLAEVTTDEKTGDIIANITNTHEIETVTVKGEKTWEDTWNGTENAYGVRPPSITVKLNKKVGENGTVTPVSGKTATVTPDANGDWKYEFTNLPKYENKEEIEYSVTETAVANYTTTYEDITVEEETGDIIANITNTIKESEVSTTVQVIKNGIEQRDIPVDVVFVVDKSASMVNNKTDDGTTRAENMISALNNCMKTVLESNPDNRVAVAAFSNDSDIILPLGHYTKSNGKYFTYNSNYNNDFRCNVSGGTHTKFEGGTYTQLGIRKGAEELMNKIGNNDKNRTPIIILITDGLPTYYAESLTPTNSNRLGDSICEKPEEGAYTILTAKYYKTQLTNKYKNDTIFLTVGIDLTNNQYATTILNPTKENIEKCENNTQYLSDSLKRYPADPNDGTLTNRFYAAKNLYLALTGASFDTLQEYGNNGKYKLVAGTAIKAEHLTTVGASTSDLNSYSYATDTLSATNSTKLISDLKELLTESYPTTDEVEATSERAELLDIDTTKTFKIVAKQGTTVKVEYKGTDAFAKALEDGVVVKESDENYYVNLKHPKFYNCTNITIEYNSK